MKVSVLTLGCRVNQSESDIIEGNLKNFGWDKVNLTESPDYCIINTCSVTAKSDYQSRQLIRRAVRSGAKVIVTGCYSHQNQEEVKNIQGVFRIVQNVNKYNIIKMLSNTNESYTFNQVNRSRPYLKIQDGCNNFCAYCVVPYLRGKEMSRPPEDIIEEIEKLVGHGVKEVTLLGQNVNSYGKTINDGINDERADLQTELTFQRRSIQ